MQDAAAEILLERRAAPSRLVPAVVLSAGVHAAAITLFMMNPPRDLVKATPPLTIRFAGKPSAVQQVRSSTPVPARTAQSKPAPPETVPPKPTELKATGKTLFGKSTLPIAAPEPSKTAAPTSTASASPTALAGSLPAVGTAGVAGLEGGDFPYQIYIDRMLALIGTHWFRPQVTGEVIAQVYFDIQRDGTIRDVRIEKSSGNRTYDRATLRAVMESSPLPPLPFAYSGTHLGVHLTFH